MTLIIGLIDNGSVYMGADSSVVCGDVVSVMQMPHKIMPKLFYQDSRKEDIIIGMAGSIRILSLISGKQKEIPLRQRGQNLFQYVTTEFVGWLYDLFSEYKIATNETKSPEFEGDIMICDKRSIILIGRDFSVVETTDNCVSIGIAADMATGVLLATKRKPPLQRIENAMKICASVYSSVCGPFDIMEV